MWSHFLVREHRMAPKKATALFGEGYGELVATLSHDESPNGVELSDRSSTLRHINPSSRAAPHLPLERTSPADTMRLSR